MTYNKLFTDIRKSIDAFKEKLEALLPDLQQEIKILIHEKSEDKNKIEHIFDTLLSIMDFGVGKKEFIQLLDYYKTIDPDGAAFYWNEYDKKEE